MHFGLALDSSDIDLVNIDLLDTHLDLFDTDIPSKHFVCLQDVFKTCLQNILKTVVLYGVFWRKWGRAFSNFEPLKTA